MPISDATMRVQRYAPGMAKTPGGSGWRLYLTHCPYGHPYDEANTRYTARGSRQCRACMKERSSKITAAKYYVKGYRDQECPICGLRWFVDATSHVRQKHGQRILGLKSEDSRYTSAALLTDINNFDCDPAAVRRRRRRWAKTIQREVAKGGDYRQRLARLWRISVKSGVENRIQAAIKEGFFELPDHPPLATSCRKGHPRNEENAYLKSDGKYQCRICRREARRLRKIVTEVKNAD